MSHEKLEEAVRALVFCQHSTKAMQGRLGPDMRPIVNEHGYAARCANCGSIYIPVGDAGDGDAGGGKWVRTPRVEALVAALETDPPRKVSRP